MTERRIKHAKLDWSAETEMSAAPRSFLFDDIYFSGDGRAETEHVFLAGNNLPAGFAKSKRFTIGELGFGTGLNLLVAWEAFIRDDKPADAKLHFLSVEKFPLSADDMMRAHAHWLELADLAERLREALPPPHPGTHRIQLSKSVSLTLIYADALSGLRSAEANVDAWFLDGFSPAKNPDMWSPEVMNEIARLSAPNATVATFTVAGAVRRALEEADFKLEKRSGFGRKRNMLTGRLSCKIDRKTHRAPWFSRTSSPLPANSKIAIIGAGVAGASLSFALRNEGFTPTIFERDKPAAGASGNPAGLIMPRLDVGDTPSGRFHASAYLHAVKLLGDMPTEIFNPCGVVRRATSEKEKLRQKQLFEKCALPEGWIEYGTDGLTFPQGGVVDPAAFIRQLISDTPVIKEHVHKLLRRDNAWRVETDLHTHEFDIVILANSLDAMRFAQARGLPLSGSAGQIDWFPDASAPSHASAFGPYYAPAPERGLIIGATYAPIAIGQIPRFSKEATQSNLAAITREAPELTSGLEPDKSVSRVSVRCTTPDRLPVAGPAPDWGAYAGAYDGLRTGLKANYPPGEMQPDLYVLTGLGSRGLVTAPLCATMIASEIAASPSPVEACVSEALHPARFYIRDLKRTGAKKAQNSAAGQ